MLKRIFASPSKTGEKEARVMRRDPVGVPDGPGGSAPFTNHRLAEWERQRAAWIAAGPAGRRKADEGERPPVRRPVLSPDATYDDLLTSSRPFTKPVPLAEMVDLLVEVWEEDGMYD